MKTCLAVLSITWILASGAFAQAGQPPAPSSASCPAPQNMTPLEQGPAADQEAEKAEIARVVSSVIGWAKDKNLDLFFGSIANDEDYISVTPGEKGRQALRGRQAERPLLDEPGFQVCPP